MIFSESDLYFAINKVELKVNGTKENRNWILDIKIHDRYDYSDFKGVLKYYKDTSSMVKSIFSSTLYNLAWLSSKIGVIKEYDIDIRFSIKDDFEVINL